MRLEEVPVPVPEAGEILVRIEAVGVNPVDWKIVEGYLRSALPISMPYTPGCDLSGTVEALGPGVNGFRAGDSVFGYPSLLRGGGYADYALLLETELAPAPLSISLRQAAALPVAAITAYDGLFVHGQLEAGMRALILGGAGGVGTAAIQLAKWKGAEVFATASARNQDYLRELGASPIDYSANTLESMAGAFDLVFDTVGGPAGVEAVAALKDGGQFITPVFPLPDASLLAAKRLKSAVYGILPTAGRLREIAALVDRGALRMHIEKEYPLSEIAAALSASKSGRTRGKLLVVPSLV